MIIKTPLPRPSIRSALLLGGAIFLVWAGIWAGPELVRILAGAPDVLAFGLVGAAVGTAATLFIYALAQLIRSTEHSPRHYLDPLPGGLRLLWPLVQFTVSTLVLFVPESWLGRLLPRLQQAGVHYLLTPRDFVALKILSAGFAALFAGLVWLAFGLFRWEITLLAMLFASFYPDLWLAEQGKKRQRRILKDLPVYLDFITLMIEGGLNLTGALQIAVDKGPAGPLQSEMRVMLRDLRAGTPRVEVFRRFGERVRMAEIRSLVTAIIQSEERGGSLAPVLRAQAEQRREERFLRAEKLALEAPVKLLAPLVMFIFPIVFLVLGFVIYMKYVQEVVS